MSEIKKAGQMTSTKKERITREQAKASLKKIEVYQTPDGRWSENEEFAIDYCDTHRICTDCEVEFEKYSGWTICGTCRERKWNARIAARYLSIEFVEYDGDAMLYSELTDDIYHDIEHAFEAMEESEVEAEQEFMIHVCTATFHPQLEIDQMLERVDAPEDFEFDSGFLELVEDFNKDLAVIETGLFQPTKRTSIVDYIKKNMPNFDVGRFADNEEGMI